VADWPTPHIENFRYMLRSGMLGWFSLMLDSSQWSQEQRAEARAQFALYKSALRPLIRAADVYHVAARPDGVHWDGIEYYSPDLRRGVLYAFRGTAPAETMHRFRLLGLNPARRYRLAFHDRGSSADAVQGGLSLMQEGLPVALALPLSSELIFLEEVNEP
jgi:alpha-galactosidase